MSRLLCYNSLWLCYNYDKEESFGRAKTIPLFYQQVLYSYSKAQLAKEPITEDEILNQFLWGNRFFLTKKVKNNHYLYPIL